MLKPFKNILVIRSDRFGEFLLNIPAIRALKETYPQAKITLAVGSGVYELAGLVDCVDKVLVWDNKFRRNLRRQKFDACVVLNPTKEAHWAAFWTGIPVKVGYDRKWGFLLTHKIKDTKYLGNRHEVDCNLELAGLVGAKTQNKSISIKVGQNYPFAFAGQKVIAIHPFTSDPVKQWPRDRFQQLAKRLSDELKIKVLIVGKEIDMGEGECGAEFDSLGGNITNLVNKTSLVELAGLLRHCSLLISGDSGPMHLASSVGTPVVALFRNDLPGKTAQRWGPWGEGHTVIAKSKLEDISVDEVLNKVKDMKNRFDYLLRKI